MSSDPSEADAEVAAFLDALESVKEAPCRIDTVTINPPDLRTKLYMLEREFRKAHSATTLHEVTVAAEEAVKALQDLGVLREAQVELHPGKAVRPQPVHPLCCVHCYIVGGTMECAFCAAFGFVGTCPAPLLALLSLLSALLKP